MKRLMLAMLLVFAAAGFAQAGDVEAGKAKAGSCSACHGSDGISKIPSYPNLAGQKEMYLAAQLQAFKVGERNNAAMSPMATPLSEADILDLAAYFASLSPCPE